VQRSDFLKRFVWRIGDKIYYNLTLSSPIDEMRQVTQTVAIVGLFLLTFSQSSKLINHSEESKEIGRIESNIEASMGNMAKHFEEGNGIDGKQSRVISKAFVSLNFLL